MKRSRLSGEKATKQFLMRGVKGRSAMGGIIAACTLALSSSASGQCEPSWTPLGAGANGMVGALAVFDDGAGPALYAGGSFTAAGGVSASRLAKWDGAGWSALGSGVSSTGSGDLGVSTLAVFDDGSGAALYAGGVFETAGGLAAYGIAAWDGSAWRPVGGGIGGASVSTTPRVTTLKVYDDGSGGGPALYVGGDFTTAGEVEVNGIARWDGTTWSALGSGIEGMPFALEVFDDGSGGGPALYAAGLIATAGGVPIEGVARWDGSDWSSVGELGLFWFSDLEVFDDGSGAALYACFGEGIAKWDGTTWSHLPGGHYNLARMLAYDDGSGSALYVSGYFGATANYIAKWNGTDWSAVGDGTNDYAYAMTVFDDGSGDGPALYAGGVFTMAGGLPASRIARWGCGGFCYADCDGSGELDFSDFLCFQNAFTSGDLYADCDGSGANDFFDFLCFQNAFAAGCPE